MVSVILFKDILYHSFSTNVDLPVLESDMKKKYARLSYFTFIFSFKIRAGGTNWAGRAAAQPVFVKFTISFPTNF